MRPEKAEDARRLRRDQTPAEAVLWAELRGRTLAGLRFRRQQVVAGFIPDFYCAEAGLVVELDGPVHDARVEADAERDAVLAAHGLRVIRFSNARVETDLARVLAEISAACHEPALRHPE